MIFIQISMIVLRVHVKTVERVLTELMTSAALVQVDLKGRTAPLVSYHNSIF